MKHLSITLFLILCIGAAAPAQLPYALLKQIDKIKLLEHTREDVKRALAGYVLSSSEDNYQDYSHGDLEIHVSYSDGTCSEDDDLSDESTIWKLAEGRATRITITADGTLKLSDLGLKLSKFVKEQRYGDAAEFLIYHDKGRGLAIETYEDEVHTIIIFPPRDKASMLCDAGTSAKQFYSRKSWFDDKLEDRHRWCMNQHANVNDLELGATEIAATSDKTVTVKTFATDPENDVLTYNYTVSGGRIKGVGAHVFWDLTGVPAGTYSIRVGVDDGAGVIGATVTKTVVVK